MTLVVGLISDTHGLLRAEALDALAGVSHIIHAGDVGTPEILDRLRAIAPVTAVRGNADFGPWTASLPEDSLVSVEAHNIYVLHILADIRIDPVFAGIGVVVSGHTHKPSIETGGGVLFINPGSAGPRRFTLPVSIGFLQLAENAPPEAWLQTLDV